LDTLGQNRRQTSRWEALKGCQSQASMYQVNHCHIPVHSVYEEINETNETTMTETTWSVKHYNARYPLAASRSFAEVCSISTVARYHGSMHRREGYRSAKHSMAHSSNVESEIPTVEGTRRRVQGWFRLRGLVDAGEHAGKDLFRPPSRDLNRSHQQ
jgi:hypothetical protein